MMMKPRTEKQINNDKACSERMKKYHAELKKLKEMKAQQETVEETKKEKKPRKPRAKKGKQDVESITPLKNNPDEFDIEI